MLFLRLCSIEYLNKEESEPRQRIRTLSNEDTVVVNDLHICEYELEKKEEKECENIIKVDKDSWVYHEYFL